MPKGERSRMEAWQRGAPSRTAIAIAVRKLSGAMAMIFQGLGFKVIHSDHSDAIN